MKFTIIILVAFTFTATAMPKSESAPVVPSLSQLTAADGEKLLRAIHSGDWDQAFGDLDFVKATLAARRIDLAKVCFRFQHTQEWLLEEGKKLPDSPFRDQVVLMMLRTDSYIWPDENSLFGKEGYHPGRYIFHDLFRAVFVKYLPDQLSYANELSLETRVSRLKIADRLETALRAANIGIPEEAKHGR